MEFKLAKFNPQSVKTVSIVALLAVLNINIALSANVTVTDANAKKLNKRIADLSAQISILSNVIAEQNALKKQSSPEIQITYQKSIDTLDSYITNLKVEYSSIDTAFSTYLTSVKPNDKDLYLSARKASEIYPKIPYYIPGTNETGEFWVEPIVNDQGEMRFHFKFVDLQSTIEKVRGDIDMSLSEIEDTQKALFKLHNWSEIAHEQKLRKNYEKRVTCFPIVECPPDGEKIDGKASTEIRFNVYEDGSTAGRIQRNKGKFAEGYNISIDSSMLLQAYLTHVIKEAKIEYQSGTKDKKELDNLFQ